MLPQLKRMKEGGSASSPVEHIKMGHEDGGEYGLLDAVAEDLVAAMESKDVKMVKSALEALVDHIMSIDEEQDKEMMGV